MADKSEEDRRKYQREYYRRTPRQQEIVKMYDKLKKVKKSIEGIRDMVMVRGTKKMGNACRVSLPKSWLGKEVLVIDTKLFEKDIRKSRV